jgi:hypothetical protein
MGLGSSAAGSTAGRMVGAVGVAVRMGALLAVLVLLAVWFEGFLAFIRLACALI